MPVGVIGAVAGLAGGVMQASAAKKAANAQKKAANDQIALSRETRDMIFERMDPFYQPGVDAQNALAFETGIGARPEGYGGFTATPGYDFRVREGQNAIDSTAAARGMSMSGATLRDSMAFRDGLASQEYDTHYNRMAGLASGGLSAAGGQATAAQNSAQMSANALGNIGNAGAAGAIGVGNAFAGGIQNALGGYLYQRQMGGMPGFNVGGGLFGGNAWG